MRDTEWEASTLDEGPEAQLKNLLQAGYPWHMLAERLMIIDKQMITVTEAYGAIRDSIDILTKDLTEVRRKQDSISDGVRVFMNLI